MGETSWSSGDTAGKAPMRGLLSLGILLTGIPTLMLIFYCYGGMT
jgi:hypothetical protein